MMLPLGLHLAWLLGLLPISTTVMTAIWVLCLAWLAMVITLHAAHGKTALMTIDFYFRLVVAVGLIAVGLYSLLGPGTLQYWIAAKLAIFGALVGCGLLIRIKLKPFSAAFAKLVSDTATDQDNEVIRKNLSATRPIVVSIWIGLLASAALGMHLI